MKPQALIRLFSAGTFVLLLDFPRSTGNLEKTGFACQGSALVLDCSSDHGVIEVTRANYGRFSIEVCNPNAKANWSVNCFEPSAKHVLAQGCNGRVVCSLSDEDFHGQTSPCPDTQRYMEAHYTCQKEHQEMSSRRANPIMDIPLPPRQNSSLPSWTPHQDSTNAVVASPTRALNVPLRKKSRKRVPITAPPATIATTTTWALVTNNKARLDPTPWASFSRLPESRADGERLPTRSSLLTTRQLIHHYPDASTTAVAAAYEDVPFLVFPQNPHHGSAIPAPELAAAPVLSSSSSASSSSSNSRRKANYCFSIHFRGSLWPQTEEGNVAQVPCPNRPDRDDDNNDENAHVALWKCVRSPHGWEGQFPDLSRCRSPWLSHLDWLLPTEENFSWDALNSWSSSVNLQLKNSTLYGGDLLFVQGLLKKLQFFFELRSDRLEAKSGQHQSSLDALIETISLLLGKNSLDAWNDLPWVQQEAGMEQIMTGIESMGRMRAIVTDPYPLHLDEAGIKVDNINVTYGLIQARLVSLQATLNNGSSASRGPTEILTSSNQCQEVINRGIYSGDTLFGEDIHVTSAKSTSPSLAVVYSSIRVPLRLGQSVKDATSERSIKSASLIARAAGSLSFETLDAPAIIVPFGDMGPRSSCSGYKSKEHGWSNRYCQVLCSNASHVVCRCQGLGRYRLDRNGAGPSLSQVHHSDIGNTDEPQRVNLHNVSASTEADLNQIWRGVVLVTLASLSLVLGLALPLSCALFYVKRVKVRDSLSKQATPSGMCGRSQLVSSLEYSYYPSCDRTYQSSLCRSGPERIFTLRGRAFGDECRTPQPPVPPATSWSPPNTNNPRWDSSVRKICFQNQLSVDHDDGVPMDIQAEWPRGPRVMDRFMSGSRAHPVDVGTPGPNTRP